MSAIARRFAFIAAVVVSFFSTGCGEPTEEAQGPLRSEEARLIPDPTPGPGRYEYMYTYFTDRTYTVRVGWVLHRCNGTVERDGVTTEFQQEVVYACGGTPTMAPTSTPAPVSASDESLLCTASIQCVDWHMTPCGAQGRVIPCCLDVDEESTCFCGRGYWRC
ncbi:hypothetical protein MFU01_74530 [Myxococcus fulvus]|uniref:Lipoprotein n=1 Tax=Myxococcus fulvus TaxID=33 RepID=A0A511TE28_MYXFU|nr:hypothetical protein MFU01_74530 [Myxococcus fulvus]